MFVLLFVLIGSVAAAGTTDEYVLLVNPVRDEQLSSEFANYLLLPETQRFTETEQQRVECRPFQDVQICITPAIEDGNGSLEKIAAFINERPKAKFSVFVVTQSGRLHINTRNALKLIDKTFDGFGKHMINSRLPLCKLKHQGYSEVMKKFRKDLQALGLEGYDISGFNSSTFCYRIPAQYDLEHEQGLENARSVILKAKRDSATIAFPLPTSPPPTDVPTPSPNVPTPSPSSQSIVAPAPVPSSSSASLTLTSVVLASFLVLM